jgi:hypothetical protein
VGGSRGIVAQQLREAQHRVHRRAQSWLMRAMKAALSRLACSSRFLVLQGFGRLAFGHVDS